MILRPLGPAPVVAAARAIHRWPYALGPRLFVLLAVGVLLLAPAWIDRRAVAALVAWDLFLLGVWLLDLRRLPPPSQIEIERAWPAPLAAGTPTHVEIALRNGGRVPIRAWLVDAVAGSMRRELPEIELRAAPGETASGTYDITPCERGDVVAGAVAVRYRSPWGIAERWASAPAEQTVRVYPDLHEARRQSMFLVRSRQMALQKRRARAAGLGRDFETLRDYRDGDEPRDICWTATARRAKIVTRVYRPERSQAVWILVDGGRLLRAKADGSQTKLDYMVNAALALAQVALGAGDRVALLTYGQRVHLRLAPGRGPQHLRAIIEALATLAAEPVEADHEAAAAAVLAGQKQRGLIVWLTDFAETAGVPDVIESASRLSSRHVVLFTIMRQIEVAAMSAAVPACATDMYRVMAAQETTERREVLLRGVRQRGVMALELTASDLTATLVDQYLSVKERNLV